MAKAAMAIVLSILAAGTALWIKMDEGQKWQRESNRHVYCYQIHPFSDGCDFGDACVKREIAAAQEKKSRELSISLEADRAAREREVAVEEWRKKERHKKSYIHHPLAPDCDFSTKCFMKETEAASKALEK